MTLTPRLRKFALTAHITSSVGWLGAVLAYLPLAISGLASQDPQTVRAAYPMMELIGWSVLVPCSIAALLTGLVQSVGTEWGLFRHYWVFVKLLLAIGATTILLLHLPAVSRISSAAAGSALSSSDFRPQRRQMVVHAAGGLVVLLSATALSVYKPWGMTRYGRSKASQPIPRPSGRSGATSLGPPARKSIISRYWRWCVILGIAGLVVILIVKHLAGGGAVHH